MTGFAAILLLCAARGAAAGLRAGAHKVEVTPATFPIAISGAFLPRYVQRRSRRCTFGTIVLDDGPVRLAIAIAAALFVPVNLPIVPSAVRWSGAASRPGGCWSRGPIRTRRRRSQAPSGPTRIQPARAGWTAVDEIAIYPAAVAVTEIARRAALGRR